MPVFEYICEDCNHEFEEFMRKNTKLTCVRCKSENLRKKVSIFSGKIDGLVIKSGMKKFCSTCSGGDCSTCG